MLDQERLGQRLLPITRRLLSMAERWHPQTAYDRAGHVLDSGLRTDQAIKDGRSLAQDRERNGLLPAGSGKRGDGGYSFIRLKKVLHARLDFLESPSPR
jgi:hypothetical protein